MLLPRLSLDHSNRLGFWLEPMILGYIQAVGSPRRECSLQGCNTRLRQHQETGVSLSSLGVLGYLKLSLVW